MAESRIVTVVATIRTTADDARIRAVFAAAIEVPLEEYATELVPCDWAPDGDTIADCLDPDEDQPTVEVIDLNPPVDVRGPSRAEATPAHPADSQIAPSGWWEGRP